MCMICSVANPTHEQAMITVAALVLGGAGGLLVPWHLVEEPVRKAGELLGRKSSAAAGDPPAVNPSEYPATEPSPTNP